MRSSPCWAFLRILRYGEPMDWNGCTSDGSHEMQPMDSYTLDALAAADEWLDSLKLHHLAEHKLGSLAVHWRGLPEDEVREIRSRVLLGWLSIADRACLTLEQFDGGIEMRMADRSKGDAVRAILSEMDIDAPGGLSRRRPVGRRRLPRAP